MGYTVATPFRDEASKRRMLGFLEKNLRRFPELLGKPATQPVYYRGPLSDDLPPHVGLSYDDGPCRIGFDYNASCSERNYVWTVCRWMALKCGRVDTFPNRHYPKVKGSFPVIVYDGDEFEDPKDGEGPTPIVLETDREDIYGTFIPKSLNWLFVDACGIATHPSEDRKKIAEFERNLERFDGWDLIRKEMERLNELWNKAFPKVRCDWAKMDAGRCQRQAVKFFRDEIDFKPGDFVHTKCFGRCGYHAEEMKPLSRVFEENDRLREITLEEFIVAQVMDA